MAEIALFGIGVQSKSLNVSAQERTNVYYEVTKDQDKAKVIAYGTPGTTLFSIPSGSPTRGMHWNETTNKLYVVQRATFYEVDSSGTVIIRGTLSSSPVLDDIGKVSMANNGGEVVIFTGVKAYLFNTVTLVFSTITLPFAGAPGNTVTFLDGRFITERPNTGQFYISALYNGSSWMGTGLGDFATAESSPDNLQHVIADKGYLVLLGSSSTELWVNNGDALFPFQRVNGAPSEIGLAAKWSLSRIRGNLIGLVKNRQGALTFGILNGYTWETVSPPDLDYELNNYINPADAVGYSYTMNGRYFYVCSFQTDNRSWLYDLSAGAWSRLELWKSERYHGDLGAAFDNLFIVSDYRNGNLYILDENVYTDNGLPIVRQIISKHIFRPTRNEMILTRLRVDMETGVGLITGQGEDPQIMLQISRDGGHTYGREMWVRIGRIGQYRQTAEWRRLGIAQDYTFKLRLTDPVKFAVIAAIIEGEDTGK